jgi:hypothetical protein
VIRSRLSPLVYRSWLVAIDRHGGGQAHSFVAANERGEDADGGDSGRNRQCSPKRREERLLQRDDLRGRDGSGRRDGERATGRCAWREPAAPQKIEPSVKIARPTTHTDLRPTRSDRRPNVKSVAAMTIK